MVREYEGRRQNKDQINEIEDSKKSLEIYEKAYACFRPECGESNAESAERHELIAAKVIELNRQRKGEKKNQPRNQHHFETATGFTHVISNKQRRTITRRQRITKAENTQLQEVNLTNDIPIAKLYTTTLKLTILTTTQNPSHTKVFKYTKWKL